MITGGEKMKTKEYSVREVIDLLEQNGYVFKRTTKGSHKIYSNGERSIAIPVQHKSVNRVMFARLIKENGLAVEASR